MTYTFTSTPSASWKIRSRSSAKAVFLLLLAIGVLALFFTPSSAVGPGKGSCQQQPSPCGGNSTCVDVPPYFRCTCPTGYTYSRDFDTCVDIDECALTYPPCVDYWDSYNNTICVNTPGSFRCECPAGYQLVKKLIKAPYYWAWRCLDVNECAVPNACGHPNATCVNKEGSYQCLCPNGTYFSRTAKQCLDVDECNVAQSPCGGLSYCANVPGSYRCACPPDTGLVYVPSLNDCAVDLCPSKPCGGNSTCAMVSATDYFCSCPLGTAYNATLKTCTKFTGNTALTINPGQVCLHDSANCPAADGSTCGLYMGRNQGDMSALWPCNRITSPNGRYKLLLQSNGALAFLNGSVAIFKLDPIYYTRERRSFFLQEDGTWALWSLDDDWSIMESWDGAWGTMNWDNAGPENGPFKLTVGNDGRVLVTNAKGGVSWTSEVAAAAAGRHRRLLGGRRRLMRAGGRK